MFVVNYEKELREAFAAGQAAAMARFTKVRGLEASAAWKVPATYEEWIESRRDRPTTVRG